MNDRWDELGTPLLRVFYWGWWFVATGLRVFPWTTDYQQAVAKRERIGEVLRQRRQTPQG
jgi:hypothetical protein